MKRIALLAIGTAITTLAAPAWAQAAPAALVAAAAAAAPVIAQTTSFDGLTITAGQVPVAPQGKLLTLTVDGVQADLAPGTYRGKVVLSVTDAIPVQYKQLPVHQYRTALYVENGAPVAAKSVAAAITGGTSSGGQASLLHIQSRGERFNGIISTGSGAYAVDRPVIELDGNGGNDFAGFGAAIMASGKSELTVTRPVIRTKGAIRTALFVGGNSTMRVDGAEIDVSNGTLPADYAFTVEVGKMMEVPWMLGLSGNARAVNLVDNGTLYLTNSHIRAQGWGALSTDDSTRVRMFVKDSLIEAIDAGYGSYSIGDSHNRFEHSIIRAADIGSIMAAEGSLTFTDASSVTAGLYGVMMHSGAGGGTLTIDKGSVLHSGRTAIQVKGIGTTIVVDAASVSAGNGILVQSMENDDPFMKAMMSGQMPEGMGPPPPGMDGPMRAGPPPSPDVVVTFRNTALSGDLYNGRIKGSALSLRLENAQLAGVVSASTVAPLSGAEPVRQTYREIGNVVNTAAPSLLGTSVSLDGRSQWTVTGTSYLTSLVIAPGGKVLPAAGKALELRVNGRKTRLRAGSYSGAITLSLQ